MFLFSNLLNLLKKCPFLWYVSWLSYLWYLIFSPTTKCSHKWNMDVWHRQIIAIWYRMQFTCCRILHPDLTQLISRWDHNLLHNCFCVNEVFPLLPKNKRVQRNWSLEMRASLPRTLYTNIKSNNFHNNLVQIWIYESF